MFCASLRSRNAHGHVTRAILCRNLQGKCRPPGPGQPFYASVRSRNGHGHVTRTILCKNLQEKCHAPGPVLCRPAQPKCTLTSHKSHLMRKFNGKMPPPRTGTTVLWEPESTYTWTCRKSHLMPKFTGKGLQTKSKPNPLRRLGASLLNGG